MKTKQLELGGIYMLATRVKQWKRQKKFDADINKRHLLNCQNGSPIFAMLGEEQKRQIGTMTNREEIPSSSLD